MPTLRCSNCGQTVRFEGVAGICPACASVVMVPKSESPPVDIAPRAAKSARPALEDLHHVAGHEPEYFTPPEPEPPRIAGMDPGVAITLVAVAVVLVLFGLYVMIESMTSGPLTKPVAVRAPAPPPSLVTEPALPPPPVTVPKPTKTPTKPATKPVIHKPAWANLQPVRPAPSGTSIVTDARIANSIHKGVNYLISHYHDGTLPAQNNQAGRDALCTYALLHANEAIHDSRLNPEDPFMESAITRLKGFKALGHPATYTHSLRATALALLNRPNDRDGLDADVNWLLKAARDGAYGYTQTDVGWWDNSNSQYGMLGIWAAADAGAYIPSDYWKKIEAHWLATQMKSGAWTYGKANTDPRLTMTAAGVTCLAVANEELGTLDPRAGHQADPKLTHAIDAGIAWLSTGDNCTNISEQQGYTYYGMERAAFASGFKFFGKHDWYREYAARILVTQNPSGEWGGVDGNDVGTAFRVLFLSRGRQPLIMNKLRFDGAWDNRFSDLTKLAQFCSARLEQPFAWGVADLHRHWFDWLDAPVLMLSTDQPPTLDDAAVEKLRRYTDNGGLLFIHNEFQTPEMDAFVKEFASRAFPEFKLKPIPPGSLLFKSVVDLKNPPPFEGISNGDRLVLVYSPTDITRKWVTRRAMQINPSSQFGMNLFIYANGRDGYHHRLDSTYVPPPKVHALGTIPVARIQYPGDWDPEPAAWTRFGRWFQDQTSLAVSVRPMNAGDLNPKTTPVATLTGVSAVDFSKMNLQALRKYVNDGGVLFIDACGGNRAFAKTVRDQLLPTAFGDVQPMSLDASSSVLVGAGDCMDPLPKPQLRQSAITRLGGLLPQVDAIHAGKGMVFVSDLDVTAGLLGTGTLSIVGYTPAYCDSLMKNVLLWTVSRYRP